ncbi:putative quinol monooxygenase [Pseudoduganella chitinolytica]|uniref:Quinol monooxygenase n=1 Tax=Pseudoduganella chitinolytica TaxID=34070 RepID=A0ABY8BF89_9BURK|nr:putative quinol monooxygenase [Pseudoduganella chitinolytica]WEF34572.1 putative quinol monooxygenase [Pseudoduganella chitinolytica]
MKTLSRKTLAVAALAASLSGTVLAESPAAGPAPLVRIAELEIDPARVAAYEAAVKEEIEASIRLEPGVLAIYAVAEKERPNRFRFFEIYADDAAYRKHIDSPHFRKYAEATRTMILSKQLLDTVPVMLGAKPR